MQLCKVLNMSPVHTYSTVLGLTICTSKHTVATACVVTLITRAFSSTVRIRKLDMKTTKMFSSMLAVSVLLLHLKILYGTVILFMHLSRTPRLSDQHNAVGLIRLEMCTSLNHMCLIF